MKTKLLLSINLLLCSLLSFAQVEFTKECGLPYNNGLYYMMTNGNQLFFGAANGANQLEPWISDGTPGGTNRLLDSGAVSLHVSGVGTKNAAGTVFHNQFYFLGYDNVHNEQIWKSDGTPQGTDTLRIINHVGSVTGQYFNDLPYFCEMNNYLYFAADDGSHGVELWRTDGTDTGTHLVKDIYTGYYGSEPAYLTRLGNAIYFRAWGDNGGRELWKTDGTEDGTVMLKDILPGNYGSFTFSSSSLDPYFKVSGSYLYFIANTDSQSAKFHYWRTDGSPSGTIQLETSLNLNTVQESYYTDVNGTFFFTADDGVSGHSNLFKSDGNSITNITPATGGLSANGEFFEFKDKLYFNGSNDNGNFGLYVSDGTAQGTKLVKAFIGLNSSPGVGHFATDGAYLYGSVLEKINPSAMENRLLQSDGTPGGTADIPHYGFNGGLIDFNDKMYYAGYDSVINAGYYKPGLYNFTAIAISGIEETPVATATIFPNPVNDKLTISAKTTAAAELNLCDIQGRTLMLLHYSALNEPVTIDTKNLSPGCYLLSLKSGGMSTVKKVVKE